MILGNRNHAFRIKEFMMKKLIGSREEFVEWIASFEFSHCHMSFEWPEQYPVVVLHHKDDNHAYRQIVAYFDFVYLSDFEVDKVSEVGHTPRNEVLS